MVGTWDDHDFGINDGDGRFVGKVNGVRLGWRGANNKQGPPKPNSNPDPLTPRLRLQDVAKKAFLDFMNATDHDPRRTQLDGLYTHVRYTSTTLEGEPRVVSVVLLDMRYNKDPYKTLEGDFLGAAQWAWLEKVFRSNHEDGVDLTLIGSSLQVGLPSVCGVLPLSAIRMPDFCTAPLTAIAR